MKEYKLAVIGATGLVGRKVVEVLQEYKLPISQCEFFASRKSAGTDFFFNGKKYLVKELKEDSFKENFDFAIFSAGRRSFKTLCSYSFCYWLYSR